MFSNINQVIYFITICKLLERGWYLLSVKFCIASE